MNTLFLIMTTLAISVATPTMDTIQHDEYTYWNDGSSTHLKEYILEDGTKVYASDEFIEEYEYNTRENNF